MAHFLHNEGHKQRRPPYSIGSFLHTRHVEEEEGEEVQYPGLEEGKEEEEEGTAFIFLKGLLGFYVYLDGRKQKKKKKWGAERKGKKVFSPYFFYFNEFYFISLFYFFQVVQSIRLFPTFYLPKSNSRKV
ncbi:hypothetical protein HMI54_011905 [Coelomomyces lativittatus]|nr:hypothetical protein HMI54_011905 [Coelomomyces lativittatus]KAJ1503778.1 hypothetical protein HMI56_001958 [Coelomomyces lativittatus]KAJ1516039.1 hypothetical protein HMI55_003099 [Coelomomyces lativittatus]